MLPSYQSSLTIANVQHSQAAHVICQFCNAKSVWYMIKLIWSFTARKWVSCPAFSGTLNKTMLFLSKAEYILLFAACEDKQPGSNLVFST